MHTKKHTRRKKRVFCNRDYASGDGMLTTVWGPAMWHYLHTMSFNYPVYPTEEDKKHYRDFVLQLQYVLPCRYCRENLVKNLKKHPLTMEHMASREEFSRYIYELHELVNTMLKKKSGLTYCDVRERYEHFRARCLVQQQQSTTVEKGCTEPLHGKKSKCVLHIVPQEKPCKTMKIDRACLKRKQRSSS